MMWSFASNVVASIKLKKNKLKENSTEPCQACPESSDDEFCSNTSREEGLECPVCWESFNIVENVPHILWCGHTLCKYCVLGLQCAVLRYPTQRIKLPFFISCPWCHLLSFRLVYKGNLKFPCKNFFLLWMVESMNGDRMKYSSSSCKDNQPIWSLKGNFLNRNQARNNNCRRVSYAGSNRDDGRSNVERQSFSFHKSLDFFIRLTTKFHLVIVFLLLVFFAIPGSAFILALYLLLTLLFAVPSILVLYFTYPALEWLVQEITS